MPPKNGDFDVGHHATGRRLRRLGDARDAIPAYAASSCPTVTVIAEHRYAADEKEAASTRRHVERVRAALVAAGSNLDTVPSGHHPHVEVPEVVPDRFAGWLAS